MMDLMEILFDAVRRRRELEDGISGRPYERRGEGLTNTPCKLVPVERGDKIVGGRKSRRHRQNKWVAR